MKSQAGAAAVAHQFATIQRRLQDFQGVSVSSRLAGLLLSQIPEMVDNAVGHFPFSPDCLGVDSEGDDVRYVHLASCAKGAEVITATGLFL